ncbi:MAG: hypothetical protein LIO41_03430 [Ruminococcus sp.]|nr:hypothetical protein [Ruminococcus sp.]
MRKNEYRTLEEFTSQYTGEWNPSEGHWFGLDFSYNGKEYRLHTGSMYNQSDTILADGRTALFGLYIKANADGEYSLLAEFATMDEMLCSMVIENTPFREIIIAEDAELLGQD